ncbi:longiborneol synthase [Emericellopsis atlantica]|uniref:Longiborneol synthase n=1 Tax=Emericellopsis atlantica TaxID=2614577 RepID=A0A9P7ZCC4_9HYPO|nr:longiborneol synthase [Emericellopsis atlantica]KAG9249469.1 longiborneol synthase [Emericellopsis atlantica]
MELSPAELASFCGPICREMLRKLDYRGAPEVLPESTEALLQRMTAEAAELDVPLGTQVSTKGFGLGFALAVLAHPHHPVDIQSYIGLFTWLVVQYDDLVGQQKAKLQEATAFQERLLAGQKQNDPLLEGIATLLRRARQHFDVVLANMLQISVLKFLTSNLLECHQGFCKMQQTQAGVQFPQFFRDMSGMNVAYAVFCFPAAQYPDISCFLEALPDIARFIDISNDVLSFYKEELEGEKRNYIRNCMEVADRGAYDILQRTSEEVAATVHRVNEVLGKQPIYAQSWASFLRGYIAMHTCTNRYKLVQLGLGEDNPLPSYAGKFRDCLKGSECIKRSDSDP